MAQEKTFTSASIKKEVYTKLTKLATEERRNISEELDIVLDFYIKAMQKVKA